jgi:uncharacterized membrane protein HdeD (DUF308 family)
MDTLVVKNVKEAVNYWWLILLGGIFMLGFGLWIMASPVLSYLSISFFIAFGIFLAGFLEVVFALISYQSITGRVWLLLSGIIDLTVGGYLMFFPLITIVILPFLLGLWMLFRGLTALRNAWNMRTYDDRDWRWLLFTSVMIILFAAYILFNPLFGASYFIIWTGITVIISGLFRIHLAFRLRQLKPQRS